MNAQSAPIGSSASSDRDSILSLLAAQLSGARLRDAQTFATEFLRRLPADDLAQRTSEQWATAIQGALEFMRSHGVQITDLDLPECYEMMEKFIRERPELWNEDIGR